MKALLGLLAACMLVAASGAARAESVAYKDPRLGDRTVFLRIEYKSRKTCEYIEGAQRGAPPGAPYRQYQLPVTVFVGRDGPCHPAAQRLRTNKTVYVNLAQHDVKLFFVAPNGRILFTESMAITER